MTPDPTGTITYEFAIGHLRDRHTASARVVVERVSLNKHRELLVSLGITDVPQEMANAEFGLARAVKGHCPVEVGKLELKHTPDEEEVVVFGLRSDASSQMGAAALFFIRHFAVDESAEESEVGGLAVLAVQKS